MLVVLSLFGIFVYASMRQGLANSMDDSLRENASQAITGVDIQDGQISLADVTPDNPSIDNLQQRELTTRILSLDGKILQSSGPYQNLKVDLSNIHTTGDTGFSTFTPNNADSIRVYTAPITDHQKILGVVQAMQSLGTLNDTLNQLVFVLWVSIPLLLVVSALSGYYLAARALSPIDKITRTARQISTEDLSARLNFQGNDDEIGRLATTFDKMLARLEEGFKREHQFTADASHELRTPLAAMQTILNVTREKHRSLDEYELAMDDLLEETDRLRSLTEGLLFIARGDLQHKITQEKLNLTDLLSDVCDSMQPMAEVKGLLLNKDIQKDLWIRGDSDSLIRLYVNLLDNAIKYTDAGTLSVRAMQKAENSVMVQVVDSGRGIPPEQITHIFERFYRADPSRSSQGFGLGLAIVKGIVQDHEGIIEVSSKVGVGTTFSIHMPMGRLNRD